MHYKRRSRRQDKSRWAPCGCCLIITPGKEPIDDGPCNGYSFKASKPISYCPAREGRKRHEYLAEIKTITRTLWNGSPYTVDQKTKICVHCGKEKSAYTRWRKGKI